MHDSDADAFLPLHPEAFRILAVLREHAQHGYAIVKQLEDDPGRPGRVLPANLYRRIRTMLAQGLIGEVDGPDAVDERRRYFVATPLGRQVLRNEARRMRALLEGAGELARPAEP